MKFLCLAVLLQHAYSQIPPSSVFILGDTSSTLTVTDLFVGHNGITYFTGQHVNSKNSLYISAVSSSGDKIFELFRNKSFEEKGLFIRPYDKDHFLVAGHSEDTTGTFNVRLLKSTYGGAVVWDTTFGNDGLGTMEMPFDLEIDSGGNIIIGGISQTFDIKYLLLKFSSSGALLWSRKSVPFDTGTFYLRDIIVDTNNNIYGLSNNSFITDTSHGTVYKWDPDGNEIWRRSYNLASYEERGNHLALSGDTLYVAGTEWFDGKNSVTATLVSLRTNGDLLSYRTIPLSSSQQGIRDLRYLPDGTIVLLDETYVHPNYSLHTFVLSNGLTVVYHDSMLTNAPAKGTITEVTRGSFTVVRYGSQLSKVRYSINGGTVSLSALQEFDVSGRMIELVSNAPPFLAAASKISGTFSERIHTAIYPSLPLFVESRRVTQPVHHDMLSAYPNPFNPTTTLSFRIPERSFVVLRVFDLLGRCVSELLSQQMDAGMYVHQWQAEGFAGGVYYVRLQINGTVRTLPLLLLR